MPFGVAGIPARPGLCSHLSSFWSFDPPGQGTQVPSNCNPAAADLLGYAAPYVAPGGDPCTLISGDGKAVKGYSLDCANLADVPIYAFVTTSTTAPKQYYYTSNPADIVATTTAWTPLLTNPLCYLPPNLPRYQSNEPIAFQSGLRTGSGGSPTLSFFTNNSSVFGFEKPDGSNYTLGITGPGGVGFAPLTCTQDPFNTCTSATEKPWTCEPNTKVSLASVSCSSQANSGIDFAPLGNPSMPSSGYPLVKCCKAQGNPSDTVGLEVMINISQTYPYVHVYSNDNTPFDAPQ